MTANTAVPPIGSANPAPRWGVATRVAFRFFFCYFVLYCFPFPFASVEDGGDPLPALWHRAVPWLYLHILHHPIVLPPEIGGTDTRYDYALSLLLLTVALAATIIWSILDRRRANYETLHRWIRLYVEVYLGVQMLSFGVAKVLPSQFLPPTLSRLSMRAGDLSTQQLLWMWMSSTRLYQAFTGWVETIGGALLFMPRLATLGALVTAGAMTNVFVINLSYNVDEKLFSFHLLAMAVFIAAPDFRKLMNVFAFHRSVEAAPPEPFFQRRWLNRALIAVTAVYGVSVTACLVIPGMTRARQAAKIPELVPFYGVWNVEEFIEDGLPRPQLVTDDFRWRRVIFDYADSADCCDAYPGFVTMSMADKRGAYWMQFDPGTSQLQLMKIDPYERRLPLSASFKPSGQFSVATSTPGRMVLDGELDGHRIRVVLLRAKVDFRLTRQQFQWTSLTHGFE